jgi:hypothetical protein
MCGLRRCDIHLLPDSRVLGCEVPGRHLHVVRRDNPNGAWAITISNIAGGLLFHLGIRGNAAAPALRAVGGAAWRNLRAAAAPGTPDLPDTSVGLPAASIMD